MVIRLIAMTSFRLNEAQRLQQTWFNGDNRTILFADTKSGCQRRPIGKPAVARCGRERASLGGFQRTLRHTPFPVAAGILSGYYPQKNNVTAPKGNHSLSH